MTLLGPPQLANLRNSALSLLPFVITNEAIILYQNILHATITVQNFLQSFYQFGPNMLELVGSRKFVLFGYYQRKF